MVTYIHTYIHTHRRYLHTIVFCLSLSLSLSILCSSEESDDETIWSRVDDLIFQKLHCLLDDSYCNTNIGILGGVVIYFGSRSGLFTFLHSNSSGIDECVRPFVSTYEFVPSHLHDSTNQSLLLHDEIYGFGK
jgi:hypothetical protein